MMMMILPLSIFRRRNQRTSNGSKGFTMTELVTAITVLILLVVMSARLIHLMSTAWRAQESQGDTFTNARIALDMLAREIAVAMAAKNNNRRGELTMWWKAGSSKQGSAGYESYSDQVYFVAPLANKDKKIDLVEVGYYLRFDSNSSSATYWTYQLKRRYVENSTADSSCSAAANPFGVTNGCWNIWNSSGVAQDTWYDTPVRTGEAAAATVASHVWSFLVQCLSLGNSLTEPGATPTTYSSTTPPTTSGSWNSAPAGAQANQLPGVVLITIKVLDIRAAQRVRQALANAVLTDPPAAHANWPTVVGPDSRTFSVWIPLANNQSNF